MRIALLGKPLSGKGTQAALLSDTFRVPLVSTGNLFRKEVARKSELGKKVEKHIAKGALVPDALVFQLLRKHLSQKNLILDGFPRTLVQAKKLNEIVSLDLVVDISCSDKVIIRRMRARRFCDRCGKMYGVTIVPPKSGRCSCGGMLRKRDDDTLSVLSRRLAIYRKETVPLIGYYKRKGIYFRVDGDAPIPEIQRILRERLRFFFSVHLR